jgi:hypothetical protein
MGMMSKCYLANINPQLLYDLQTENPNWPFSDFIGKSLTKYADLFQNPYLGFETQKSFLKQNKQF